MHPISSFNFSEIFILWTSGAQSTQNTFLVQNWSNENRTLCAVLSHRDVVCLYVCRMLFPSLIALLEYSFQLESNGSQIRFLANVFRANSCCVHVVQMNAKNYLPTEIVCVTSFHIKFTELKFKNTVDTTIFVLKSIVSNGDAPLRAVVLCRARARFILVFYTNSPNVVH